MHDIKQWLFTENNVIKQHSSIPLFSSSQRYWDISTFLLLPLNICFQGDLLLLLLSPFSRVRLCATP